MLKTIGITSVALFAIVPTGWAAGPNADVVVSRAKSLACESIASFALGATNLAIASARSASVNKGFPAARVIEGLVHPRVGVDGNGADFVM